MPRNWLESVTNVVLIVAGLVVIAVYVSPYFRPAPGRAYSVGQSLKLTSQARFTQPTFLLHTASTCGYCTDSMPLYRDMVKKGAKIIATTSEPLETNAAYLKAHGVEPLTVVSASSEGLMFSGTPALILIGTDGKVKGAWYGKQNQAAGQDILRSIE